MTPSTELIKDALATLLQTKPYAAIRIQDICETAGVSRKTFAKWFTGKDDVVCAQMQADFADPVRKVNSELPVHQIESASKIMLVKHYRTFYDKRMYYLALSNSMGALWIAEKNMLVMQELNREIFAGLEWMESEEKDFAAFFISSSHAMILVWWIQQGMKTSPDDLAKMTESWLYAHQREIDTSHKRW